MLIRDLTEEQRNELQRVCRYRLHEYNKSGLLLSVKESNLWDKAFSEGARAILAKVDKLNG